MNWNEVDELLENLIVLAVIAINALGIVLGILQWMGIWRP
jgi:type II secretory pathway pseudopilin PulG